MDRPPDRARFSTDLQQPLARQIQAKPARREVPFFGSFRLEKRAGRPPTQIKNDSGRSQRLAGHFAAG
jgi:hypothetical protein